MALEDQGLREVVQVFREVLEQIARRVDGTLALSLLDLEGIPVDSINPGSIPLEHISAELTAAFKSIRVSNTGVDTGDVEQLSVTTDRYQIFLFSITSEYYVLMVMSPEGNHGRARWELKRARYALQDELV